MGNGPHHLLGCLYISAASSWCRRCRANEDSARTELTVQSALRTGSVFVQDGSQHQSSAPAALKRSSLIEVRSIEYPSFTEPVHLAPSRRCHQRASSLLACQRKRSHLRLYTA